MKAEKNAAIQHSKITHTSGTQIMAKQDFFETINRKKHTLYHANLKHIGLKSPRDFLDWVMLRLAAIIEHSGLSHFIKLVYVILFVLSHHFRGKKKNICNKAESLKVHTCLPTNTHLQFLMDKRCFSFINSRTTVGLFLFIYVYSDQKEWKKVVTFKLSKKNIMKK